MVCAGLAATLVGFGVAIAGILFRVGLDRALMHLELFLFDAAVLVARPTEVGRASCPAGALVDGLHCAFDLAFCLLACVAWVARPAVDLLCLAHCAARVLVDGLRSMRWFGGLFCFWGCACGLRPCKVTFPGVIRLQMLPFKNTPVTLEGITGGFASNRSTPCT